MKDPVLLYIEAQQAGKASAESIEWLHSEPDLVAGLINHLNGSDPRVRSGAAALLAEVAKRSPAFLQTCVSDLALALEQEELQTRLAATRAITAISRYHPEALEDEIDTIRLGLFDPANPEIRAETAEAIAHFGSHAPEFARRVFPHLAEALRRFHDQGGAADLLRSLGFLARRSADELLRSDVWRAVRRYEKHADPTVRAQVEEIRRTCSINPERPRDPAEE